MLIEEESATGAWKASTVGYSFRLLSREEREVLAYHWHPDGSSPVTFPHLHVGCTSETVDLRKAHLPTGWVTLIDVRRLAITDFGVEPLRPDWRDVLAHAEDALAR